MSIQSRLIRFPGSDGQQLAARVETPVGEPRGWALFAHCFSCSKDLRSARVISTALADAGVAVFRFDFTGLGESEGDFSETNFSSNLDDLVAAADHMRAEFAAPRVLIGHSLGGAAVLAGARRIAASKAVAVIGAPSEAAHLSTLLTRMAPDVEARGEARLKLGGREFTIKRQLLEDLEEHRLRDEIGRLRRALLVLHSPVDEVVHIDHARRIFEAARHPKSFVSLDRADHLLLSSAGDARYAGTVLAAWASRYVDAPAEAVEADEGEVVVRGGPAGYATRVLAGKHELWADEPVRVGGTDQGPTPYGLLLASLGT